MVGPLAEAADEPAAARTAVAGRVALDRVAPAVASPAAVALQAVVPPNEVGG